MARLRLPFVFCLICSCDVFGQQSSTQTMQILKEWATLQSVWGVPSAQPLTGSSLNLVEKNRETASDGHTIIHYNFVVKGLPAEATYLMEYWPVGGPSHPFQKIATGLKINKEGLVVCLPNMTCGDKKQPEFPLEIAIQKTAKGETHRFVLTSEKNSKIWVTGLATPYPLRSASGECRLEMIRMTPNGEMVLLSGTGFPANQPVTIQENSAGEDHAITIHTDLQGNFQRAELPFVLGKSSGLLEDKVTLGTDCHPSLSIGWGEGSRQFQ
jgi:hypothetical protein